jgi:signal peptidase II
MLPNQTILTNLIGLLFSVYLFYRISKALLTRTSLVLGLVLGGVLGNLGERLVFGRVTDFIAIESFAVINLADVAIVFGLAIYLVHLVKASQLKK